ncbi:hypothetical protein ACOK4R_08655 [Pseudomonas fluorescens]|nr:hypothetical protein [Pseudomonas fluorescens]
MIQNYSAFPNITLESASLEFMNHLISALQTIGYWGQTTILRQ